VILLVILFGVSYQKNNFSFPSSQITASILFTIPPEQNVLNNITLEQKIGQLFMVGFNGTQAQDAQPSISQYHIGGIILLDKNLQSTQQTKKLTTQLQEISRKDSEFPLLIGIDQEGGEVSRIPFTEYEVTSQSAINSPQQAHIVAKKRGEELRDLGINLNFSPVLDVITDSQSFLYSRTFQKNPQETSDLGKIFLEEYKNASIIGCPKHFPGHGNALTDPHISESINTQDTQTIQKNTQPFTDAIQTGTSCVMVGHTTYKNVDQNNPASQSPIILINWLRNIYHFNDIIITDDMEMQAAHANKTIAEASLKALQAGADVILISGYTTTPKERENIITYISDQIKNGALTTQQLDEKISRILKVKNSL